MEMHIESVVVSDSNVGYKDVTLFASVDGIEYYVKTEGAGLDESQYTYGVVEKGAPRPTGRIEDELNLIITKTIDLFKEV